jgi:hypothetical protein
MSSFQSFNRLAIYSGFSLGICLAVACPSTAQAQTYGRGPGLGFYSPTVGGDSFSPSSGVNCPTPSLVIGAYGGGGNDWSDNYLPNDASSSAGINNYGIAAGLRIPLGAGELSRACKDFAKAKTEYERINTENFRRNAQISLFRQCNWLRDNLVKINQPAFSDKAFSSLQECSKLDYVPAQGVRNAQSPLSDEKNKPPESSVTINTTQTLQVEGRTLRLP